MSVVPFPGNWKGESDRLLHLIKHRSGDVLAADLGNPDDWAWSAISYLKGELGSQQDGSVDVSACAVSLVIAYVERLAGAAGIIGEGSVPA